MHLQACKIGKYKNELSLTEMCLTLFVTIYIGIYLKYFYHVVKVEQSVPTRTIP